MAKSLVNSLLVNPAGKPIKSHAHDPMQDLVSHYKRVVERCADKSCKELSNAEKFALCALAGAAIHFVTADGGDTKLATVHPCRIGKVGGVFQVAEAHGDPTPDCVPRPAVNGCAPPQSSEANSKSTLGDNGKS